MRLRTRIRNLEAVTDTPFMLWDRFKETGVLPTYEPDLEKVEAVMAMFMVMHGSGVQILTEENLGFTPTKRAIEWARAELSEPERGVLLTNITAKEYADIVLSVLDGNPKEWPLRATAGHQYDE